MPIEKSIVRVVLFYFVLVIMHFGLFHFFKLSFSMTSDIFNFLYPILSELKRNITGGYLPMWFPGTYTGFPLLFMGSYDIKSLLLLPWFSPMNTIVLHASFYIFFAGVSSFVCLRKLYRFSDSASFLASLFWTLSQIFTSYYYDQTLNSVYIYIPIFLVCLIHFEERPALYFFLMVMGACDQLSTGRFDGIEISVITIAVALLLRQKMQITWYLRRFLIGFSVFITASLLLFPLIYEQFTIVAESNRRGMTIEPLVNPFSLINFFSLVPKSRELFGFGNGMEIYGYIGPFFILLFVLGVIQGKRRAESVLYLSVAAVVSLFAYDVQFFGYTLFDLYRLLPGHSALRYAQRIYPMYFFLLCVPVMAGWDALCGSRPKRNFKILVFALFVFFAGLLGVLFSEHGQKLFDWNMPTLLFCILVSDIIIILALLALPRKPLLFLAAATCIVQAYAVSLICVPGPPTFYFEQIQNNPVYKKFAADLRAREPDAYNFRVFNVIGDDTMENNQFLIAQGFHLLSGYQPLAAKDFVSFVNRDLQSGFHYNIYPGNAVNPYAFGLANVKYFILPKNDGYLANSIFSQVSASDDGRYAIYENHKALPRAYLVHSVRVAKPEDQFKEVSAILQSGPEWFKTGAVVSEGVSSPVETQANDQTTIESYQNDQVKIRTNSSSAGYLVLADKFDSARWAAKVDGVQTEILRANGIFRAVKLSEGTHAVEFFYARQVWAWWLSALGLFFLVLIQLFLFRRNRLTRS